MQRQQYTLAVKETTNANTQACMEIVLPGVHTSIIIISYVDTVHCDLITTYSTSVPTYTSLLCHPQYIYPVMMKFIPL